MSTGIAILVRRVRGSSLIISHGLLSILLFVCGILAVQRFSLDSVNSIICLLPYLLFIRYLLVGKLDIALTCLALSLFFSISNGGGEYTETPAILRYMIYVSAFLIMINLSHWVVCKKEFILGLLLLIGLGVGTLANVIDGITAFDETAFRRDMQVLFILLIFVMPRSKGNLVPELLYVGCLGYLVGEVINVSMFFTYSGDYLNYDSLKVLIMYPLLYAIMFRHPRLIVLGLAVVTFYVISLYGTRMITVTALLLATIALVIHLVRTGKTQYILLASVFVIFLFSYVNIIDILYDPDLIRIKAISFVLVAIENFTKDDLFQVFAALDPVRFAEHQLFFSRSFIELIFGSGLGSGVIDDEALLGFVTVNQTAFSDQEIYSGIFYNLHDFWIDFGYRFGLIPIVYIIYLLTIREMWKGRFMLGVLFGLVLLNTTFANSGILLTALLVRFMPVKT